MQGISISDTVEADTLGFNLEMIADQVGSVMEIDTSEIWKSGKSRRRVAA